MSRSVVGLACLCAATAVGFAQTTDYTELSLEELTSVRIFTLGRKQATLFDTPSAASVVTADDMHRAGAITLADALRLAPGVQASRIDSFNYAITARGFNDPTASKLLVLMDGRSLYSTTSTGTYWNYHELVFEDLDRIEVLRGPGASLWGANAMNGVVNIVSKQSAETLGSLFSAAFGDELDAIVTARHGFRIGDSATARVYAKYHEEGDYGVWYDTGSGGWANRLAGARVDWTGRTGSTLTVIGELRDSTIWSSTLLAALVPPYFVVIPEKQQTRGGNVSAHWVQPMFGDGELSVLGTYERFDSTQAFNGEDRDTVALDAQLTFHPHERHEVITGLTARQDKDVLTSSPWMQFRVREGTTRFTGAFIQDEIAVIPDRLLITLGSKFERNSLSGWETQPSARAILRTTKQHRTWVGVSRAARTPSRMERQGSSFGYVDPIPYAPLPLAIYVAGTDNMAAEHVHAFELGHRYSPSPVWSFDLSLYRNEYRDLRSIWIESTKVEYTPVPRIDQFVTVRNNTYGSTHGGEFVIQWQPGPSLRWEASMSAIRFDLREYTPLPYNDPTRTALEGSTPRQEYRLSVHWDPTTRWSFDAAARRIDAIPAAGIPAYTGLDARIAYRPNARWELEVIGRDVLDPLHAEAAKTFVGPMVRETARSIFLRATYRR